MLGFAGPSGCVAAQLCSASAFGNDAACAAGADPALSLFDVAGTCTGVECEQSSCCVPPQLCSAAWSDAQCVTGSDDSWSDDSLTVFNAAGTCASTLCFEAECCVAPAVCSAAAWSNDASCAAGADRRLPVFNANGTCSGHECLQAECCMPLGLCSQSAFSTDLKCSAGPDRAETEYNILGTCRGAVCQQDECCHTMLTSDDGGTVNHCVAGQSLACEVRQLESYLWARVVLCSGAGW